MDWTEEINQRRFPHQRGWSNGAPTYFVFGTENW